MGLRAIPAQRLLTAHPSIHRVVFSYGADALENQDAGIDPIVVFSPSMFLPAVIARAEALARFVFGSSEVLGVRRSVNEMSILGVEADVAAIDGSPQGVLRSLLMMYASEQVFSLNARLQKADRPLVVDLASVRSYYISEGAPALRGERDDLLTADSTHYEWTQ